VNRTLFFLGMGIFSFLFGSAAQEKPSAPPKNPANAGRELRQMMLDTPPDKFAKPAKEFPRVYAVLMDWPIDKETATILSSSEGAASLYTTSTFGIIGGEGHENVRKAAIKFVRAADRLYDEAKPTKEYPYPAANRVRFYLLTFQGVRVLEADLVTIASGKSKYTEYFGLGQDVLTELRLITEKAK
jgi:hypothetical protein